MKDNYTFYLMHLNKKVIKFKFVIHSGKIQITKFKVLNKKLIPYGADTNFKDWIKNRIINNTDSFYFKIENLITNFYSVKNNDIILLKTLEKYGISPLDNYWFNPVKKYKILKEDIDEIILMPTKYKNIKHMKLSISYSLGDFIENLANNNIPIYSQQDFITQDLYLIGKKPKRIINNDNILYVRKFLNQKQIEKNLKINNFLMKNFPQYALKIKVGNNYIDSLYFLENNEEYLSCYNLLLNYLGKYNNEEKIDFIKKIAIDSGLTEKEALYYFEMIKIIDEKFGLDDTNIGFIVDSNTNKIKRCAPIR